MALPEDFSKIYGSTATGGLTPISDVNYAKGWEFVGSNPPTKNDFSYLQNLSDLKSQWLYSNKLQRTDPFGDIKSDGTVPTALKNLGLGSLSKQDANAVAITGGSARLDTLDVSNTASFSGTVTYKGLDYLIKNSFVNAPSDNSNSTFGLRLSGQGGQRSDELFYEKIGEYAARRFVVISGGGSVTFDMRQDGSFVSLNPGGNYQIYPDGNISGTKWGGYLFDYINNQIAAMNTSIRNWAGGAFASINYVNQTFMKDSRLGSPTTIFKNNGTNVFTCPSGYTFSSVDVGDVGSVTATARPVQKLINNTWITVSQL